ncbi:MAG: protein-tyrosine-phosphatase [Bacteroidota bacterium]
MYYPTLSDYIQKAKEEAATLTADRKAVLAPLIRYIQEHKANGQFIFICTHNSRRSHFGQIWAHVAALEFGLDGIKTFSGGTEATAFHPNAIAAVERAGIIAESDYSSSIPLVNLSFGSDLPSIKVFSKRYDDEHNPNKDFAAVMTCSEADADCPIVFGATARIPLHYVDPKVSDGTEAQESTYDERCRQIASEMMYTFDQATS